MAKPRVFISSTFYDLRQVRADIDLFLKDIGYDSVRNEEGNIPYGKEERLEEYCYKEIQNCDILVSIIGGRFGSESMGDNSEEVDNRISISQKELRTAIRENKQVYIFIDKNVRAEYETYLLNKLVTGISYRYVDDERIYKFIEDVFSLPNNNNIKEFEISADIVGYLREQFAGLFQHFISRQDREKELNLIEKLQGQTETLDRLVKYLSDQNKDHKEEMEEILMLNHPLVNQIKSLLGLSFKFYINGMDDLNGLLSSRSYYRTPEDDSEEYYTWTIDFPWEHKILSISRNIFKENGHLKYYSVEDWKSNYVKERILKSQTIQPLDDESLPF